MDSPPKFRAGLKAIARTREQARLTSHLSTRRDAAAVFGGASSAPCSPNATSDPATASRSPVPARQGSYRSVRTGAEGYCTETVTPFWLPLAPTETVRGRSPEGTSGGIADAARSDGGMGTRGPGDPEPEPWRMADFRIKPHLDSVGYSLLAVSQIVRFSGVFQPRPSARQPSRACSSPGILSTAQRGTTIEGVA